MKILHEIIYGIFYCGLTAALTTLAMEFIWRVYLRESCCFECFDFAKIKREKEEILQLDKTSPDKLYSWKFVE